MKNFGVPSVGCRGQFHLRRARLLPEDALSNLALLCPNHHRAVHRTDAPLDFADMAFDFRTHREGVRVNRDLGVVA